MRSSGSNKEITSTRETRNKREKGRERRGWEKARNLTTHCCLSVTQSCPPLCDPMTTARRALLSITNSQSLLKHMSIESGGAIQPSHPLSPLSPPALKLSQHQGLFQ